LERDRGFRRDALCQNVNAFLWASSPALANLQDIIELINNNFNLNGSSEELRNNKKVVLAAVRRDGNNLAYASEELRGDREVVLESVRQNGDALLFAGELRADREVVLEAVQQNGTVLCYASEELQGDRDVVMAAQGPRFYPYPVVGWVRFYPSAT